jgi:hypothetical protein
LADHRNVQAASDRTGDILESDRLVGNPVIASARGAFLEREPKQNCGIEPMHGGPAIETLAHIGGHRFFACNADQRWNEAVVAVTVDRRRETNQRYAHAARRNRACSFIASHSRKIVRGQRRDIFFGRNAAGRDKRGAGSHDQRTVRAHERGAEGLDRMPIDLADLFEACEVMDEPGVKHAVRGGRTTVQAVEILEITPMDLGARGGQRFRSRFAAREAEYLMSFADEFLNDCSTDESGGAGDEHTHEDFLDCFDL